MILKLEDKTLDIFAEIKAISDKSFDGAESPPPGVLHACYTEGDVFVLRDKTLYAFAIVCKRQEQPYLWSIAVSPNYREQGVGEGLLRAIIWYYICKGYDTLSLTVRATNVGALRLYLNNGFIVTKVLRNDYGPNSDGLIMRRNL